MENTQEFESVFCSDEYWQADARINFSCNRFDLYATGYKDAGDRLVELVVAELNGRDTLIYPIVFLYRQYIELRLKEIIKQGRVLLEKPEKITKTHNLLTLWADAKKIIDQVFEHETDSSDSLKYAEHVIKAFSTIDKKSYSFRYPINLKGQPNLEGVKYINIVRVALHVNKLSEIIDGVSTGISVYLDDKQDMEFYCQQDISRDYD